MVKYKKCKNCLNSLNCLKSQDFDKLERVLNIKADILDCNSYEARQKGMVTINNNKGDNLIKFEYTNIMDFTEKLLDARVDNNKNVLAGDNETILDVIMEKWAGYYFELDNSQYIGLYPEPDYTNNISSIYIGPNYTKFKLNII